MTEAGEVAAPIDSNVIAKMVCHMVHMGWQEEAKELLLRGPCGQSIVRGDPSYWLSFLSAILCDRVSSQVAWHGLEDLLRNTILIVLSNYIMGYVGREPVKHDLRRKALHHCECPSCRLVNGFLSSNKRARQIFPIGRPGTRRRALHPYSDFSIPGSFVEHIVRQLSHDDRDCTYHIRVIKSAGQVLAIQKRQNTHNWHQWSYRKTNATERLRGLMDQYLVDIVNDHEYKQWISLSFVEKKVREWKIPFSMDVSQNEVIETCNMFRISFASIGSVHLGDYRCYQKTDNMTIIWTSEW